VGVSPTYPYHRRRLIINVNDDDMALIEALKAVTGARSNCQLVRAGITALARSAVFQMRVQEAGKLLRPSEHRP
jgi:hypothetical protein